MNDEKTKMKRIINRMKYMHSHPQIHKNFLANDFKENKRDGLTFILWNKHLDIRRNVLIKI